MLRSCARERSTFPTRTESGRVDAHSDVADYVHALVAALRAAGAFLTVDPGDGHLVVVFAPSDSPAPELLHALVDEKHAVADYLRAEAVAREAEAAVFCTGDAAFDQEW